MTTKHVEVVSAGTIFGELTLLPWKQVVSEVGSDSEKDARASPGHTVQVGGGGWMDV